MREAEGSIAGEKAKKFAIIKEIINSNEIANQEELLSLLSERNVFVAQATLSRYLKQMKVVKTIGTEGEYIYRLPQQQVPIPSEHTFSTLNYTTQVDFSLNIVVIHTRPGFASSLASEIDDHASDAILGTVAGDDTIFAVKKENITQREVIEALTRVIPNIKKD